LLTPLSCVVVCRYVDYNDYRAIYTDAMSGAAAEGAAKEREEADRSGGGRGLAGRTARDATRAHDAGANVPGSRRYGTLEAAPGAARSLSPPGAREGPAASARPPVDRARMQLLTRAFDRYDVDGDGRISVDDLQLAFAAQGRPAADLHELVTWVRRRDRSGVGLYVTLEDFVESYR
jgi:hypothetical protein